jgi:hypothetical protein
MKWNFESKSEQRDYLHNHLISRCNSFALVGNAQIVIEAALTASNDEQSMLVRDARNRFRKRPAFEKGLPNSNRTPEGGLFVRNKRNFDL